MSIDELIKLNSLLKTPTKENSSLEAVSRSGAGTKRKANRDYEGWEGVTVMEVKRKKKNENGKKKPPDSSPDSSPVFYRKLSTAITIHRTSSDIGSDLEDDGKIIKMETLGSFKSNSSSDFDASLPIESPIVKKRPTVIDFDEIIIDESFPLTPPSPAPLPPPESSPLNISSPQEAFEGEHEQSEQSAEE